MTSYTAHTSDDVTQITNLLQSLPQDTPAQKEAISDCLYSLSLGVKFLEQKFDQWLWAGVEYEGKGLTYAIALGQVEEALVMKSMIYND